MIDARPLLGALERPTLVLPSRWLPGRKRVYEGRILSHAEFDPFARLFGALDPKSEEWVRVVRQYLRTIGIPPRVVFRLPAVVMLEVITDFLACQWKATTLPGSESPPTNGSASPLRVVESGSNGAVRPTSGHERSARIGSQR